jgi:hypothetical protein
MRKQTKPRDCHCGVDGRRVGVDKYNKGLGYPSMWVIDCPGCNAALHLPGRKFTRNQAVTLWNRLQKEIKEVLDGK